MRAPHHGQQFRIASAREAAGLPTHDSLRLQAWPSHWCCPVRRNPHAAAVEAAVLSWLFDLGCSPAEVARARKFDAAGYVGLPFPLLSHPQALRVGKYLALWLLWDDVHLERPENRWRLTSEHILSNLRPPQMTRFDEGWWQLFQEFAAVRSPRWLDGLCNTMTAWCAAAMDEALMVRRFREQGEVPSFDRQLQVRIATIGMFGTVYLLEDGYGYELPVDFHAHPTVQRMTVLANQIVGLGNDLFSCAKDVATGQLNLVTTVMQERGLTPAAALETIIQLHDESLQEYDQLAETLGTWSPEADPYIARWVQDVRYASLGFTLWEAQAPRYAAHRLVVDGAVVAPSFLFVPALASAAPGPVDALPHPCPPPPQASRSGASP
ncbi:MAG: hypothetical protein HY904_10260 [Deltaproteobacteria bacterium]|nr:hypothetical protein [Deltaproteobacteria bacterium]